MASVVLYHARTVGAEDAPATPPVPRFRQGVLLVKFRLGQQGFNVKTQQVHQRLRATVIHTYRAINWQLVRLRPGLSIEAGEQEYREQNLVRHTARDYFRQLDSPPNDELYPSQPSLNTVGSLRAWQSTHGSRENIIAVIDTGARLDHPDLTDQLWSNPGEGSVPNGRDDDGNRYIDDIHGIDGINPQTWPADDHGHGTHCSGVAAAHTNNYLGVASLSWGGRLMVLKALDNRAKLISDSHAIACLSYVIALRKRSKDMKIVNISWGGPDDSEALAAALTEVANVGVFVACSAGNQGEDNDVVPHYPSNYRLPGLIAVGANDLSDSRADFSNYGATRVHLAAPGVDILTTCRIEDYCRNWGTSMAAPQVAAAAALLFTKFPNRRAAEVKVRLITKADKQPLWMGRSESQGRLNIDRALNDPW